MWNVSPIQVRSNRSFFLFPRAQNGCFRLRDRYLWTITDERVTISTRRCVKSCCERSITVTKVTGSLLGSWRMGTATGGGTDSYPTFLHTPRYAIYFQIGGIEKFMTRLICAPRKYRENKMSRIIWESYFIPPAMSTFRGSLRSPRIYLQS